MERKLLDMMNQLSISEYNPRMEYCDKFQFAMQKFLTAMIIQNDCKNNYKVLNITKSSRKFNRKKIRLNLWLFLRIINITNWKGINGMRETRIIEFKETITNTFLKTVSAFSNYNGGEIYFGIDDNGNVKGIADVKQSCLDIENKINDSISPQPDYTLEIQNDSTIKLTVKSGIHKPYLYKSKAYKRNDTATIEVDTLEFSRLILEGKNIRFEELPYNEQKLTFEVLHQT